MHDPWTCTKGVIVGGNRGTVWSMTKGKNWDNCNSIINKIRIKNRLVEMEEALNELVPHLCIVVKN